MNWKQADIPLLASPQGGVAERSGKYCEASADREARVVFRMNPMETTPAASASVASRYFFDYAATPPCGDARRGMAHTILDFLCKALLNGFAQKMHRGRS